MVVKCFFLLLVTVLPIDHKYRKNRMDLFVGRAERDVAPPLPSSEELYDIVSEYNDIVFGF
jgi:hypothetical protein